MLSFHPEAMANDVADPYEHGPEAFVRMFDELEHAVEGMLDELEADRAARVGKRSR